MFTITTNLLHNFIASSLLLLLIDTRMCVTGQFLVEILEHTVLGGHRAVVRCDATGANFGADVVSFSFTHNGVCCALPTEPALACSDVEKPRLNSTTQCIVDFAVVARGNCSFSEKAFYVQEAKPSGYKALIVYNFKGKSPNPMSGSKFAELVKIPVVMVKYECMQSMLGHFSAEHGYTVTIKASPGYYDLVKYLFPFVVIVGVCFVILFISLLIRLCRERRRLARKRLPRSALRKIPTRKYKKGDPEETCPICLEDFKEADKLRILPCKHAYHSKCVDPWLTKNRKVCPVCKRRVGPRSADSSDSDETDSERLTRTTVSSSGVTDVGAPGSSSSSSTVVITTRDNRPLMQHAQTVATTAIRSGVHQHSTRQAIAGTLRASSATAQQQVPMQTAFSRASNFLHLSSIFHPSRCEINQTQIATAATSASTPMTTTSPLSTMIAVGENSNSATITLPISEHSSTSTRTTSAPIRGRLRRGIAGISTTLAGLVQLRPIGGSSFLSESNTQLIPEAEEEDATSVAREESDTLSRRTLETLDDSTNVGSSPEGHSMTTMLSDRNLLVSSAKTESPSLPATFLSEPKNVPEESTERRISEKTEKDGKCEQ